MSTAEFVRTSARVAREHVTSRLQRARTFQGIVQSVADEATSEHIPFDHCCLYFPATHGRRAQVWRAARPSHEHDEHARTLDDLPPRFTEVFRRQEAILFGEDELHGEAAEAIGVRVRSALAMPLADEAGCFGALWFTSHLRDAYAEEAWRRVEWIAETVACVVRAALAREHDTSHSDETATESRRLKQYFVRTLVRDVRLPLSGVVGVLHGIEAKLDAGEELTHADRRLLRAAIEHGERVCFSVDNHLEVAQDAQRALSLDRRRVATNDLINGTIETVRADAALNGVGIHAQIERDMPDLFVDSHQTARLLMHVLDAALAQTHEGGRIWVEARGIMGRRVEDEGRPLCRIDVTEDGAGLSPDDLPYVFDAFRFAPPSPRTATNSNIGLAIARRIAVAHGGNVHARSSLGVGTVYSITLPAC